MTNIKYNLSKPTPPAMPRLGKGTESVQLLLSQVSKDMHQPIVPMIFPILGAHVSGAEFMYPDLSWKETSGMLANLVADSGAGKGQLSGLVEAICRDFRAHDEEELTKLVEWQKMVKTKSANKEKPVRPDVAFWFPPADVTNAAFIQNAMGCEKLGQRTQYLNMPEVEMADRVCGGHRQISQMMRNIYDRQRAGALRATADGVTGNPVLRANITISSTPFAARKFYKNELFNGTFGRMVFSYKPRQGRDGRIPRQGKYGDDFYKSLDEYLARLAICKGRFIIKPLNRLIDQLAADMASLADLADDDTLWDIFACRPCRRRHPLGHLKACPRIGMEGRMPALGAQQPDVDCCHGASRGMAGLPRHLVEDAGVCRLARSGRGQRKRGWQAWSEEYARRLARLVQRGSA